MASIRPGSYVLLSERVTPAESAKGKMEQYAAFCDELGLATCGSSSEEAKERLRAAVINVLNYATKEGIIEELLSDRGIRVYQPPHFFPTTRVGALSTGLTIGDYITHRPYEVTPEGAILG